MTREEAIKILKAIRVYECYPKSASEETKEAIDMAIEALSAKSVEVVRCKDCIRAIVRDEYIGRLWCSIHRGYMEDTYYCADGFRSGDDET